MKHAQLSFAPICGRDPRARTNLYSTAKCKPGPIYSKSHGKHRVRMQHESGSPETDDAIPSGMGQLGPAYLTLGLAQIIPLLSQTMAADVVYFLVTASSTLFIGAKRNMLEPVIENLDPKSAILAPVVGSSFLFGVYCLIKYTDLDINTIYNFVTSIFGMICLSRALLPVMQSILPRELLSRRFDMPRFLANAETESKATSLGVDDITSSSVAACIIVLYAMQQNPHFFFSNALAFGIGVETLALVKSGSVKVAAGLLMGLFLYDCFWVFGSDVMLTVATKIDAPAKFLFPKDVSQVSGLSNVYPYAVLGLGDIVVPGVYAALMLTMDKELVYKQSHEDLKHVPSGPYFSAAFVAYVGALLVCFGVNSVTHAAQPALFYLVPALLGSSVWTAWRRREWRDVLQFQSKAQPVGMEPSDEKR